MYRYRRLLVGLDLSDLDTDLVRYTGLIARMAGSESTRFVHVTTGADAASEIAGDAPRPEDDEERDGQLRARVEAHFDGPKGMQLSVDDVTGVPLVELLRLARDRDKDLVIMGRDHDGGTLSEKVARKAPCSVLIVPPGASGSFTRVLVPTDFSSHAADAVDVAVAFAEAAGLERIDLLHVYKLPTSFRKLGKTEDEAHEALREALHDHARAFLSKVNLRGLDAELHLVVGDSPVETIQSEARRIGADLIVAGTRGRTDVSAVLLGSVAEQLVRTAPVPVVAVKRKGATLPLLDALFNL
jgi:nucleotide-binding universal stress UspA family protein